MRSFNPPIPPKAAAELLSVTPRKVQLVLVTGELEGFRVERA